MRKHLFVTLLLTCGLPFGYGFSAFAEPAPQTQNQNVATITGTVLDENNEPVIGASVMQKGVKTNAVTTNFEGNFVIKVAPGTPLRISYVGYKTEDIAAANGMTVYLQPTTEQLDQLVVVGYGTQKKANLTGAVSTVDVAKTMEGRPYQDLNRALQGAVPGLTITTASGDLAEASQMRIRGMGTLSSSNAAGGKPLIVVDGIEMDDFSHLNTQDIESISVLKDAASTAIYGTRAAFGVILIQTKGASERKEKISVKYSNNFGWDQATYLPDYPDVPSQLRAGIAGVKRANGGRAEGFGINYDELLPYAEAWLEQNGDIRLGYQEMRPYVDENNVGDYCGPNGKALYYANWDVAGILFNNAAPSNSHNLSISGTTGKTNYYMNFAYDGKQGLYNFNPDKMRKYNASINLSTKLTNWLEAGARINFARRTYSRPNTYWSNQLQTVWRWGSWFGPWGTIDGNDFRLISDRKEARTRTTVTDFLRMTAYLKANITKDLVLNADFTYWTRTQNGKGGDGYVSGINQWNRDIEPSIIVSPANSYTDRSNSKQNVWNMNVYATYNKTWNDVHNFTAMVGVNAQAERREGFGVQKTNLYNLDLPELNLAAGALTLLNNNFVFNNHKAYAGYFGRVSYNYNDTYLLEVNARYDGSSSFPGGKKWAMFPSVSAGYRISQEKFWEPIRDWASNAKIRFSYGEVGNEDISLYTYRSLIDLRSVATSYWVDKQGGQKLTMFNMPTLVSSDLTWERIRTTDVGADFGFLDNSLNVTFDWYQRTNSNMLAPVMELPAVVGADAPVENAGSLRTRGWELSIGWNHSFGDWMVYANASISDAKTVVTKWDNDNPLINSNYTGKVYGDIWGFETDRYFTTDDLGADGKLDYITAKNPNGKVADQTDMQLGTFVYGPGDIKYKDLNGDGVIDAGKRTKDDHGDLKVIGNTLPRYEYSFRIGGAYKGFDLDLFFQGVGKRDVWSTSPFNFPLMRLADLTVYKGQTDYCVYDPENGIVDIDQSHRYPALYAGNEGAGRWSEIGNGRNNYYPQTRYLTSMAYLRLKNVTFGYTVPVDITKKFYVQNLRVYFSCNNPCLLYKGNDLPVDPEVNAAQGYTAATGTNISGNAALLWGRNVPMTRTFSFGLQVTF